ncbi:hypothetical protein, variant 1 [Phytophthora nicotianae CJ01A1]|uniref:SPRY domain-containing protein n=5 Tax=Phytophthora nicotianae TaxID=4792 RepID=W2R4X1_PHYN3|nr:hypothetical protein, variant 1 [Phytophthora nicotianae INRA-310]ETI38436.1 hypothetical protein, variant 1 [Phytophthora nicotianae P1569]ETK78638.1 hypothetical protein, variant 1 [Phytophthora nicotianae]ETO67209.1 hypothetical protein, variant 1 [Phytophthora nicotianae P1976]ETP08320.1 hypothetical protein, variant 1 [Phytophthora nicotianae CJ01A1]ETL32069.1 hypothetical protein, variant 1 [Phytophthora nicotianae]
MLMQLILVCIGLLEALDRLQERLHLPTSIVKELKHRLAKMVARSSVRLKTKCPSDRELGDAVADSCVWDTAKPEEVRGVVHWVLAVTSSLQRLVVSASLGVCKGIYVLIMSLPGVSTACSLFYGLLQAVEDTLRLSSEEIMEAASAGGSGSGSGRSRSYHHLHHRHHRNAESYVADPSLTAVVLEYREKECMVPSNIDRRIRRVMHFQIPLHSFEATVRLPPDTVQTASSSRSTSDGSIGSGSQSRAQEETTSSYAHLSSATPRSIPVSPLARKRVQLAFSNFSDDVLYQARDQLRQERAATLTGDRGLRVPRFNAHDCHEDIYLSCGRHCASKVGTGMYRSVRASVPLQKNRFVYFEMTLQQGRTPARGANQNASRLEASSQLARGSSFLSGGSAGTSSANPNDRAGIDASVCIGLSTRLMPLNTLVGASKHSIGFYSAGHVLVGSERRRSIGVGRKYGFQSTVGVLAQVVDHQEDETTGASTGNAPQPSDSSSSTGSGDAGSSIGEAFVRFTVDGIALRDSNNRVMEFTLPVPSRSELYPTLTLHSQDAHVFSQMSAPDITSLNLQELDLPVEAPVDIWCLDGLRLGVAA